MGDGETTANGTKQRGVVKFFDPDKGYGFIRPKNNGKDVFVHISTVQAAGCQILTEGELVAFNTAPGRNPAKGPQAVDLDILGEDHHERG